MKKLPLTFIALLSAVGVCSAGEAMVRSSKDFKAPVEIPCFQAHEWQFDVFGQYSVGEGPRQVGLFRDHAWGGGVGVNYFFTQYLGIGVDGSWIAAKESPNFRQRSPRLQSDDLTTVHNTTGSLILRFPISSTCLAPYVYAGGGFHVDGQQWASAHGGVGVEYRVVPNKIGLFLDGRWTYLGDRESRNDLNFFSGRAGIRFVF